MEENVQFADDCIGAKFTDDVFLMFGYTFGSLKDLFTYFQACVILNDCEAPDEVSAFFFVWVFFFFFLLIVTTETK